MTWQVLQGDCIATMAKLPEGSVDAVVCDPPYGLEFMGKEWDRFKPSSARMRTRADGRTNPSEGASTVTVPESYVAGQPFQEWCRQWASEALRVLKPGGHLLAFGGTRTYHRLVCGVEDAGFEIRDRILDLEGNTVVECPNGELDWVHGQGFPKGKNVHAALVAMGKVCAQEWLTSPYASPAAEARQEQIEAAAAELEHPVETAQWEGWNVALKPAHEPIVVARKPLIGTVAENVLRFGTGGINIDGCRVGMSSADRAVVDKRSGAGRDETDDIYGPGLGRDEGERFVSAQGGRHPGNVVLCHLEDCEQVGTRKVQGSRSVTGEEPSAKTDAVLGDFASRAPFQAYADEDGTETVEAWNCAPGCPVAALDEQSGELTTHPGTMRGVSAVGGFHGLPPRSAGTVLSRGDSGGASKFFPTFGFSTLEVCPLHGAESIEAASTSAGKRTASSADNSPTDGCGSKPTDLSRPASTSTTETTIPSTTTSPTSNSSSDDDISSTTDPSERRKSSGTGSDAVRNAESGSPSSSSPSEPTDPASPTAQIAAACTCRIGESETASDTTPICGPTEHDRSAPRFHYCAKASRAERNAGLAIDAPNGHPTVKPLNLMRWLVRLVTPPGGTVLDPFLGSGSTGCAAVLEDLDFIGIEREAEYVAIAEARISFWAQHVGREVDEVLGLHRVSQKAAKQHSDRGQVSIDELLSDLPQVEGAA